MRRRLKPVDKAVERQKGLLERIDYGLLAALFIPLLAVMPLLTHAGLPNTADGPVHLMRQVELNQAWAEGNFYPRWGTDLALGHGMPIFSYAPPFLYQLTQLFHLSGLPLDESMKGVLTIDFLLYSLGMFLFARRLFGSTPALIAAAVYVYAPYRLREAYIQGNYGQFSGLAFYPLIFWAFHALISDGHPRYLVAAALSLAGLLFSHNISFMLFVPIFAAYLLFLLAIQGRWSENDAGQVMKNKLYAPRTTHYAQKSPLPAMIIRTAIGGVLGLGLAAIFWLPAFGERHDIKLEGITQGFFDFRENFISLPELLSGPLPLDLSAINPAFPLSLGLPQLIGATAGLLALLVLIGQRLRRPAALPLFSPAEVAQTTFFGLFLLLYAFLATPQSQLLWETVPLLELAEFPWRMLGPAIFCAAVLAAAGYAYLDQAARPTGSSFQPDDHGVGGEGLFTPERRRLLLLALSLFGIVALNIYYLYPSQFISWGTPTPAEAFAYEAASGAIGTTSTGEFLPRWTQQHPQADTLWPDYAAGRPPQRVDPADLPPGATVENISHRAEADTLQIDTPQPFEATLRRLYWPGWRLYLNGEPLAFTVTPKTGLIRAPIPAGQHRLTLQLESTPLRRAGVWLSGLSSLILLAIALVAWAKKAQANWIGSRSDPVRLRRRCGLTVGLLLALYLLSRPLEPLFVLRSDPDYPQPADQTLRADFEDQLRLVGMDNLPTIVDLPSTGAAELNATLYWRAQQPLQINYTVFLHLDGPDGQTLATVDEVNPENIPTGNWPPGLYLRNPLRLELPADLPPIRYELTTGLYQRQNGRRLTLAGRSATTFSLGPIWLKRPLETTAPPAIANFQPDRFISLHQAELTGATLRLMWRADRPVTENYTIFIHILDVDGQLLDQADGAPYDGLYPLSNWLPGQPIIDERQLELPAAAANIAIGIYDPASSQRLPAYDATGQVLPHNSYILPVAP